MEFKKYSIDNGLSQSRVYDILQDYLGYIWVATEGGLNKFDGYEFYDFKTDVTNPTLLYGSDVRTLFEDSKGRLWVGTAGDGIVQYYNRHQNNFTTYFLFADNPEKGKDIHIRSIGEDKEGNIWVGTHPTGLFSFNPEYPELEIQSFINPNDKSKGFSIGSIFKDSKNNLWVGGNGLYLYDSEKNEFISFYYDPSNDNSISGNGITDIFEDSYGTLWVLTYGGLNALQLDATKEYNQETAKFTKILSNPNIPNWLTHYNVGSIAEDNDKNLWVGSFNGLYKLKLQSIYDKSNNIDISNVSFTNYTHDPLNEKSLNFNNVRSVYCDNAGIIWVGTSAGLNQSINRKFLHFHQNSRSNGLSNNKIEAILEDKNNNIWICNVEGVDLFDPSKTEFTNVLPGPVLSACESKNGLIYFGTWLSGLIQYNPKNNQAIYYRNDPNNQKSISNDHIFSVFEDKKNNLWVGTWSGGLNLFDRKTNKFIHYKHRDGDNTSLCSDYISYIYEDSKNNLWIGTLKGLGLLLDKDEKKFKNFSSNPYDNTTLQHNHIIYIHESRAKQLWIGTMNGLHKYNFENNTFKCYTTEDGLPDNRIMGILEDDSGNLWITTKNGLARFTPPSLYRYGTGEENNRIKNFDIDDGLQSREFVKNSCFKGSDGNLYFGGINGCNVFNPRNLVENTIPPSVYITSFKLFNKEVLVGESINNQVILSRSISETNEIELSYKNNIFTFGFTALNYNAPEQTKYAYKMEGFDRNWNYVDNQRIASYTNLNHGEYIFRVKASNNDGIWNEKGQSIKLIITPPFWKTWWFRALMFLFIALLTFSIIEARLYRIKQQKNVLEVKVTERTIKIVKQKEEIEEQAQKIVKMNSLLKKHNIELEENVHNLEEARIMQKLLSFEEYNKLYPSEYDCLKLLESLKWQNGFKCRKCDSNEYSKDEDSLARRCKLCNYKESVTSWTIFHRLRFPLQKALYILILTNTGRQLNISKLSETVNLRMKTCWEFHNKVKNIRNSSKKKSVRQKEAWKDIILLSKKKTPQNKG